MDIDRKGIFWFRLNSNMFNIAFAMGMSSYKNWSKYSVGTHIFDVFRWSFDHLPYLFSLTKHFLHKNVT